MHTVSTAEPGAMGERAAPASAQPDRYQRLDIIGRGSFGDVYRGCAHALLLSALPAP